MPEGLHKVLRTNYLQGYEAALPYVSEVWSG